MKKKFAFYLSGILLALSLTACAKGNETPSETSAQNQSEETSAEEITAETEEMTETEEGTDNPDASIAETKEPEELEIIDCVPEGPSDIDFGPDNMGFYMEGETFTLPMPYNEFLTKAESLGWSINEEGIDLYSAGNTREYAYGEILFERSVENQENPEEFEIKVINSVDPAKDIDLTDPDIHVVTFYMHMFASSSWKEIDGEEVNEYHTFNVDSQLYLTKEIGMGRNILNSYAIWGEDDNPNSSMYSNVIYTTGDGDPTPYQMGMSFDRYIWLKSDSDYAISYVFGKKYGKAFEYIITSIKLNNNPYIQ